MGDCSCDIAMYMYSIESRLGSYDLMHQHTGGIGARYAIVYAMLCRFFWPDMLSQKTFRSKDGLSRRVKEGHLHDAQQNLNYTSSTHLIRCMKA